MRILVVEDEPLLADAVAQGLRHEAHAVDVVYDGGSALERIDVNDYDVVVLDRDVPVVHGDRVCQVLAERKAAIRVLMLTAAAGVRADGTAVSAETLLEKAWDENADPFTHAVRMTILKLRRKLGDPPVVLTEPGVGYRIR